MSTRDFLHFLFETSQVDASTEALLRESEALERMTAKKTPLLKALKGMGIPVENVTVDEEGAKLTVTDGALYHEIVRKLGSIEAINNLADEGWLPEFAGDVADTTELPEYVLNFLPLHEVEPSEQDKATPVDKLNKEVQGGSDTVIPAEQKKRDEERRHGVKEAAEPYKPFPIGTIRGPYHDQQPRGKAQTQFMVNGPGGWVPFIRTGANCEAEARKAAETYAATLGSPTTESYLQANDPRTGLKGQLGNLTDKQVKAAYAKEEKPGRKATIKAEAKRRGIKLGESEVDALLEAPADPGWPANPSGQPQGTGAPWEPGHGFDHLPDAYPKRTDGASVRPSWTVEPNGDLKITINDPEDQAELKEKVAAGDTSDSLFIDAIDHALGNGLNLVRPETIGALTSSLILSDVPVFDEEDANDAEGAKFWWYPDYQVRSPVEDLAEKGFVIFKPAQDKPAVTGAPAPVGESGDQKLAALKREYDRCGPDMEKIGAQIDRHLAAKKKATSGKKGAAKKDESVDALLPEPGDDEHDHELDDYDMPTDDQGKPIIVAYKAGADEGQMGWEEFIEVNGDGMDFSDFSRIRDTILKGETYRGGGGAAGEYTVARVWPEGPAGGPATAPSVNVGTGERFYTGGTVAEAVDALLAGEGGATPQQPQGAGIKAQWSATDTASAKRLGAFEFKDNKGQWHDFEVLETPDRLVFGGAVNAGFLESGYLPREEDESTDAALQELRADLEVYYNDGPNYVSRIIVNERM